jgi:hypothetical protein
MIKSCYNFNDFENDDFWLHRYSSANHLESTFKSGNLNLRFSTALNFEDPLEGWDFKDADVKNGMDGVVHYYNRVINAGGTVEYLSGALELLTQSRTDKLKKIIKQLNKYSEKRSSTYISCWFKTDTLEEENRAMWKLYGNNEDGVRVSVKWSDLKKELEKTEEEFEVGFIDYGNQKNTANLYFIKDKSYSNENEFRILFSKENSNDLEFVKFENLNKLNCTTRSKHNLDCYNNRLKKLGFNDGNNSKLKLEKSNLLYESKQVNWEEVLGVLNNEIISRNL